ncbi:DinB family protein [Chloroflexota bacterium]
MNWQQLLIDGFNRVHDAMKRTLDGLTKEELDRQPRPDANSTGWLCWHLTRGLDRSIVNLRNSGEQLWIKDKWHTKFNRPVDPKDTGFKHEPDDVQVFKSPEVKTFIDYHGAVLEQTKKYIESLIEKDLDRKLDEPWFMPTPTVGVRLISLLAEGLQHIGQAAYIRGLFQGKGWLPV